MEGEGGGGERRRRVERRRATGAKMRAARTREAVGALDDALARLAEEDAHDALARVLGDPVIVVDHRKEDQRVNNDPLGRDGSHLGGALGARIGLLGRSRRRGERCEA